MSLNLKKEYGLFINNKWVPASDVAPMKYIVRPTVNCWL